MSQVEDALRFAERIHRNTFRKSGEPYISHPVAVKNILKPHGFAESVLCAALLHDVLEDTKDFTETDRQLYELFDEEVYFYVTALSKDKRIRRKQNRDEKYHRQLKMAMKRDASVIFLKAADLLHNVSTLEYLSPNRQKRWIRELKEFYLYNFMKHFHLVPPAHIDFYHQLMAKLQEVVMKYESKMET